MASILNVDQIKNAAGTSAMTIDSSGDITLNGPNTASVSDSGWITATLLNNYTHYDTTQYLSLIHI